MGKLENLEIKVLDSTFNPKGYFTVGAHGNQSGFGFGVLTEPGSPSSQLKAIQAAGWNGKDPIVILACNFGNGSGPAELASLAQVPVIAATGYVWPSFGSQDVKTSDGTSPGGQFIQTNPNGSKQNPFSVSAEEAVIGVSDAGDEGIKPKVTHSGYLPKVTERPRNPDRR